MSSSKMEEASIGVPSPLVMVINSNLVRNESGDGTSQSLHAMDILGEGFKFTYLKFCCVDVDPAGSPKQDTFAYHTR